jgi:sugar/nucleoside kinase (ribokinase family)
VPERTLDTGHIPVGVFVGLSTLDVVHHVEAAPGVNQKVTARAQSVAAGGPATNAAVAFAALGGDAVLITALGSGAVAQVIRSDLEACRVRIVDVAADQLDRAPISSITVLMSTGERSVVSVDAGTSVLDAVPNLSAVMATADVVLVDGHHPALAEEASRAADAASIPLVIDAGRWKPVMGRVIARAEAVICSADFRYPGTDDSESSARALIEHRVPTVIVTHGGDPVAWWHGGMSGSVAPPSVHVVDTSGAGDAFHGAYCYLATQPGYADIVNRITTACRVASIKCSFPGTRSWLSHLPDRAVFPSA